MSTDKRQEARRQVEICNACRYCEGFCSVFPAVHRLRFHRDADLVQLASLCHNCRGCYYACQYTAPHEFDLNLPKALAEVRQESWQQDTVPAGPGGLFHRNALAIAAAVLISIVLLSLLVTRTAAVPAGSFYSLISHNILLAVFIPAFVLPLISIALSLRNYWQRVDGQRIKLAHLHSAFIGVAKMTDLSGGHGDGCNFEDEDRFSNLRRWLHQCVLAGFILCFAATGVATLMHYGWNRPAPYDLPSLPKLFGLPGGIMLSIGSLGLALLKRKAEPHLSDATLWYGEMAFILLLFAVSTSGLALYGLRSSHWCDEMLVFHLGTVLALFLLTPFSKMAHGFYRTLALVREAQLREARR